mgnify:CR=1 FL=1
MDIIEIQPPRKFSVGLNKRVVIKDCAHIRLEHDEQVTFVSPSGANYDVCQKSWGFYATPSINGRLAEEGFRTALVRNKEKRYYIMIVENNRQSDFLEYLRIEKNELITWLSDFT